MIKISRTLTLPESDVEITFVASPGPGGQNVNKLATAAVLRFNIATSALPEAVRERLHHLLGPKVTAQGDLIIKASRYRTQELNRQDALERLIGWITRASHVPKKRKKTRPTFSSVQKRLKKKKLHSQKKTQRRVFD